MTFSCYARKLTLPITGYPHCATTCNPPLLPLATLATTCDHWQRLQPLATTCSTCNHLRPLATTCDHLQHLQHLQPLAAATCNTCCHLQRLQPLATTCNHLQPTHHVKPSPRLWQDTHLQPITKSLDELIGAPKNDWVCCKTHAARSCSAAKVTRHSGSLSVSLSCPPFFIAEHELLV